MPNEPFQFHAIGGVGLDDVPAIAAGPIRRADGNGAVNGGNPWIGIGYDATHHTGKRRQPHSRVLSEDLEARDMSRRLLTTSHRDLYRNAALAGWMVRAHLDSISSFHFRAKTADDGVNFAIQQFMTEWSRPENCDGAGRHSLPDLIRLWCGHATLDGDVLINRIKTGKLQTIEGDRVQTFGGIPFRDLGIDDPQWVVNGVWINPYGRPLGYMVFRRPPQWGALQWDRMIPARFADMLGYYFRYDQLRGVSPLASAANMIRDIYEGFDYALVKAKISQYFGIKATRRTGDPLGTVEQREDEEDANADPSKPRYDINFGRGPAYFELDEGDDLGIIESQTPSTQFQGFMQAMILVAMKALDLPFSFFDESHTNFNGSRMAGIRYEAACEPKRRRTRQLLDKLTGWRLGLAIADGDLKLPAAMRPEDVRWEWTHTGLPLFNPLQEVSADVAAVNAGFASEQEVCRARGKDFHAIIDERAAAAAYAKKKGVVLSTALASVAADDPDKSATQKEDASTVEAAEDEKARTSNAARLWGW